MDFVLRKQNENKQTFIPERVITTSQILGPLL